MNDERKRILRMLAEGTISVDECEELLESLKDRQALPEEAPAPEEGPPGPRPRWPYFLLAAVLLIGLFTSGLVMFARWRHRLSHLRQTAPAPTSVGKRITEAVSTELLRAQIRVL